MIPLDDPMSLSLLFHLNSEPWLNDEAYRDAAPTHEMKQPPAVLCEWPMPAARHTAVGELIARRLLPL